MKTTKTFAVAVLILLSMSSNKIDKKRFSEDINLSSVISLPNSVVPQNGCLAQIEGKVEIKNPHENLNAEFKLSFNLNGIKTTFEVLEINDQQAQSRNPLQYFIIPKAGSIIVKVLFKLDGRTALFNKAYKFSGFINPRRYQNGNYSFTDIDKTNDNLEKEVFLGSPNVLCFKCIETENFPDNTDFSFIIPSKTDYEVKYGCTKATAELKLETNHLIPIGTDLTNVFFKMVSGGDIANTTIKTYLIKNNNGKYLTNMFGVPKFIALSNNDTHGYQKWVISKEQNNACGDRAYSIFQYIDGNNCKTLLLHRDPSGQPYLLFKNGIITNPAGDYEKVIISPRYKKNPTTNKN